MGMVDIYFPLTKNKMTKITVYELSAKNYSKIGKLKKSAVPEMALTFSDPLDGSDDSDRNATYAANAIKKAFPGLRTSTPYIFTHIRLSVPPLKNYAVYEHVRVAGDDLITSPTKLLAALNA